MTAHMVVKPTQTAAIHFSTTGLRTEIRRRSQLKAAKEVSSDLTWRRKQWTGSAESEAECETFVLRTKDI